MVESKTLYKLPTGSGNRVRIAISLTGLKITEFCAKTGLPVSTVFSWENERFLLTKKGAIRLSSCLSLFEIQCSPEWLLTGNGLPPSPLLAHEVKKEILSGSLESEISSDLALLKEIDFFKSLNPRNIVLGIRDNSMIPFYEEGDYVGGYKLEKDQFSKAIDRLCIVKTQEDLILIRKMNKGSKRSTYTLIATNLSSKAKNLILQDIKLKEVSIIVWHRKTV